MAPELERSIDRLRLRALQGAFLGTSLRWLAIAATVLAGIALLLRVAFGFERAEAAWVFAPLVLVPLAAWIAAKKRVPSRAGTVAWLDVRSGGTGAIVGAWETTDPRWAAQLQRALAAEPAQPRFDVARPALISFWAIVFGVLVLSVPIAQALVGPPVAVQEATLERVEEQLAALQEQVELEPEVAAELQEALERLRREGALAEPEGAFEALDRAQEKLEQEAYERAEAAQSAQEDLADAADQAASNADAAQEKLERTLGQLAQAGFSKDIQSALEKELGAAGVSLPPGTKLDAGQITAISKELAEKLGLRAGELGKAGLIDARSLAKLGELAKLDGFEFEEHVCDETCEMKPGGT